MSEPTVPAVGYFPGRAPIDAYGRGGFRFASMSHKGSLIALPSGTWSWDVRDPGELTPESLARILIEPMGEDFSVLLLGTGAAHVAPSAAVRKAIAERGLTLDVMTTGAACRTYNIMLAEKRPVGAALMVVP